MPLVVYTLLRVALLLGAAVGLYLLGMRGLLLAGVAIVLAALLSYLVLPRQRTAAAVYLAERAQRRGRPTFAAAMEDDARVEDAAVDGSASPPGDRPAGAGDGSAHPGDGPARQDGSERQADAEQ